MNSFEHAFKRKNIGEYSTLKSMIHTPSQSPLQLGNEKLVAKQLVQLGSQGDFFVTTSDLEEGMLKEPPMPIMDLTLSDFKGKELEPIFE